MRLAMPTLKYRPFNLFLAVFAGLALTACATSTPYGPATRGGFGYTDQRIDGNRYRVTFRGNSSTSREQVENSLLFRAAELTVQNGFDHFIVVENDTEAKSYFTTLYGPAYTGFGPFYGRYRFNRFGRGRFGRFGGAFPYYPYGFGFGPGFYGDVRENRQYSAIAFISLHKGAKPDDEPAAFDARQVMDNLRALIIQPDA